MNLETPLTDYNNPIEKCGPNLMAPTTTINGLKRINPFFFTLANNNILDQDKKGLNDTINILKKNNIDYAGVGNNIKEASKPYIADINGYKIGFYSCVEHEFFVATEEKNGC